MSRIRSTILPLIIMAILPLFAGCSTTDTDGRVLAVSIPPQKAILDSLSCGRFEVVCLIREGSDAETSEPDLRQMVQLENAETYFSLGGLPFEQSWIGKIEASFPHLQIVNSAENMDLLAGHHCGNHHHHHHHEHGDDHDHGDEFDPHVWTSLRNAKTMATDMYRELLRLDPIGKAVYDSAFVRLSQRLDVADDSIRRILEPCCNRVFMTWHPSLGYFAKDYDLTQLSVQQEGKEVSPRRLADAIVECRDNRPAVLFCDEAASAAPETSMLQSDLGIKAYNLRLMSPDFVNQLIGAAKAISENQ